MNKENNLFVIAYLIYLKNPVGHFIMRLQDFLSFKEYKLFVLYRLDSLFSS